MHSLILGSHLFHGVLLPLSHAVSLNTVVQSSSLTPSLSESVSALRGLNLLFSHSLSSNPPAPHLHLRHLSLSLHLYHHQGLDSVVSCPKSHHCWNSVLP